MPGSAPDPRPPVWVGHVLLHTDRLAESAQFMRTIGMRPIHEGPSIAIFELRGGTHLLLLPSQKQVKAGDAPFDLMVEDLDATHAEWQRLGLDVSPIERGRIHSAFVLRDPDGNKVTVNSSHVVGDV